ncbi:chemotaxis protein CheW [Thiohalobacter sp. IOR34]|uniref:chemotaxis protein CheW n=1 Tax=Thiohalobacter sp. IOR34 TaxID=3057176 RepID=UPI0025B03F3D|nr:chemotaxis protein CheW [Thiohalobacter sp. IOR34]WJW76424.1 chemotaxis protein CheW [Thiohalobacter sp. IOR34]
MNTAQQLEDGFQDEGSSPGVAQYLTFILAGEEYGVDILRVQEIKGWERVTPIPNTPEFIKGVINLRGTIVPIIDLRQRFGLEWKEYGKTTVVIVLKVRHEERERTMGIVVDAVSEVYDVQPEETKPTPDFGGVVDTDSVKGLATVDGKMIILLDIDHLINAGVLEHLGGMGEEAADSAS